MEISDVYDINGNRTGKTMRRGDVLGEQEYACAAVAVVRHEGFFLITRRHPDKSSGGLWEFPGGGMQSGELAVEAAVRELEEETGIHAETGELKALGRVLYAPTRLFLEVFLLEKEVLMGEIRLQKDETVQALKVNWEELQMMYGRLTPADQIIFDELKTKLEP